MNADWLDLELPETGWEHPAPPPSPWPEHVAFVDEMAEMVQRSGRFAGMLGDIAVLHRSEPFVLLD